MADLSVAVTESVRVGTIVLRQLGDPRAIVTESVGVGTTLLRQLWLVSGGLATGGFTDGFAVGFGGRDPYASPLVVAPDARAGIMRAGIGRANAFSKRNPVITIHDVDRTRGILIESVQIQLNLNAEPDTVTFTVRPDAGFVVTVGQTCTVGIGGVSNLEFGGQIVRATFVYKQTSTGPIEFQEIEAVDWGRLIDRRLVVNEWVNQSASTIAHDIRARSTQGFTGQAIAPDLPIIDRFAATNESPQAAFMRLANLINGGGYVDAYRDIHLFGSGGDTSPNAGTNPQPLARALWSLMAFHFRPDASQQRTRVVIEGQTTTCPIGSPGALPGETATAGTLDVHLVAGGGFGGDGGIAGGGGGGGVREGSVQVTSGASPITVGAGGASFNTNGSPSTAFGLTAIGGGQGRGVAGPGIAGGSGGGGCGYRPYLQGGGAGTPGQGFAGGIGGYWFFNSIDTEDFFSIGGGGGGADGVGGNADVNLTNTGRPGNGGPGRLSSISGTPTYYGGGGAGSSGTGQTGVGGIGGGGNTGVAGAPNTGGGGGAGAAGGSGRVTISYHTGDFTATGGTITTVGSRTIHTFTSDGVFTVNTVSVTLPPSAITTFPIDDGSQLDPAGGTIRVGNYLTPYTRVLGPALVAGQNPPGTTLTGDAIVGAVALAVPSDATTVFTQSIGWVKVGDQYVQYTAVNATALTIPSEGYGSLGAPVASGSSVTWISAVLIPSTTFDPPVAARAEVVQRVTVNDGTAQGATAILEGGDGIHEHLIADTRLTTSAAENRGLSDLGAFSSAQGIIEADWDTRDCNARPGRQQVITFGNLSATLLITRVTITFPTPNGLPVRTCQASSLKQPGLYDVVLTEVS